MLNHTVTVLLEYIAFITIFYKCMNIAISVLHMFPSMLALCLMLSMTHYAQNYAGIIGGSLPISNSIWTFVT